MIVIIKPCVQLLMSRRNMAKKWIHINVSNVDSGTCHRLNAKRSTQPGLVCMCKDENGQSKDCYKSKEDAQRRSQILKKEMGANLYVYQCPETDKDYFDCIWHLTKKEPQQFTASRKSVARGA